MAESAPHDEREAMMAVLTEATGWDWDPDPEDSNVPSGRECVGDLADALLAAGYRKPTVQPTARPTTEGGVWGSYVAYLEALESRVQPTVEELERTIYDKIAFQGGDDEHFESVRGYIYHDAARAVHALFTTAPTVADVREQVARELWAKLPDTLRAQTHDDCGWLSDAQDAQLDATDDAVTFCGQGSIDVHHIADYAANLARGGE